MYFKQIVHRYWGGSRPMPEEYVHFGEKWEELNPGWIVKDWGEEAVQMFPDLADVINDLYERDAGRDGIELHVQVADVLGYAFVREFGGIYVNCDMEPVRALPDDLPDMAFASYENEEDWRIVNAAIGAPQPNDPFWVGVLVELPKNYFDRRLDEMVMSTGPGFLTEFNDRLPGFLHVFPKSTFNSVHWKQIEVGGDASGFEYPESAIAVHHWGHRKDHRSNRVEEATQWR